MHPIYIDEPTVQDLLPYKKIINALLVIFFFFAMLYFPIIHLTLSTLSTQKMKIKEVHYYS